MRLALTVVSPAAAAAADVVLDADPATPVAELAAELEHFMFGGRAPGGYAGQLGTRPAGTRVLQFPASRAQGSLAMSSPAAYAEPQAIPLLRELPAVSPQLDPGGIPDQGRLRHQPRQPRGLRDPRAHRPGRDPGDRRTGRRLDPPARRRRGRHRRRPGDGRPDPRPRDSRVRAADHGRPARRLPGRRLRGRAGDAGPGAAHRRRAVAARPADRRRRHAARARRRTSRPTRPCTPRRTAAASTSTGRRGCSRPSGSPGSSCRTRRPRPNAARSRC